MAAITRAAARPCRRLLARPFTSSLAARSSEVSSAYQTLVKHTLPANDPPAAAADRFAVIQLGGAQYKVAVDDVVVAEKVPYAEVGASITVDDVGSWNMASGACRERRVHPCLASALRITMKRAAPVLSSDLPAHPH